MLEVGCIIKTTPINPIATAPHLKNPTFSFSKITDNRIIKRGDEKLNVVATAKSILITDKK